MQDFEHPYVFPNFSMNYSLSGLQVPLRIRQHLHILESSWQRACSWGGLGRAGNLRKDLDDPHVPPRFPMKVGLGDVQVPFRILQDSQISMSSQLRACDGAAALPSPPALCQHCSWGYANQMLLKLLLATHLHTEFYLTLDADVLLRRPLRYNGAQLVHWEVCHGGFECCCHCSRAPLRAGK